MKPFLSDCWEAFVISGCYRMGDPLTRHSHGKEILVPQADVQALLSSRALNHPVSAWDSGGGRLARQENGGHHPSVTS